MTTLTNLTRTWSSIDKKTDKIKTRTRTTPVDPRVSDLLGKDIFLISAFTSDKNSESLAKNLRNI
jgi:hypothetical protein